MSVAVGAQTIDLAQPPPFEGYDTWYMEREGLLNEGGSINYPWLIAQSAMIGNAATVGFFFHPRNYEDSSDDHGLGQNWVGAGGRGAVGGTVIWW